MVDSAKWARSIGVLVASLAFACSDAERRFESLEEMSNGEGAAATATASNSPALKFPAGSAANALGASTPSTPSGSKAIGSASGTLSSSTLAGNTANGSPGNVNLPQELPPNSNNDPLCTVTNPCTANPGTVNPSTVNPSTVNPSTVNPGTVNPATPQSQTPSLSCASGQYASAGACKAWTQCASGSFVTTQGTATSDRVCSACKSGQFSEGENAGTCNAWLECKAGEYVIKTGSANANRTCGSCASGSYSTGANAGQCSSWQNCAAGSYVQAAGSATADRKCATCAASSFTTAINSQQCTAAGQCAAGTYQTTAATTTAAAKCSQCARGNYCAGGTAGQVACPSGTWDGNNTASPCIAHTVCAAGTAESNTPNATTDRTCAAVTPVEIASVSPVDAATGVARNANISVTFKTAMDKTVNPLSGISGCSFTWSSDGKTLTCNPADFATGTSVSWGVSTSAKDAKGTALTSARSYSFRVVRSTTTTLGSSTTLDGEITSDGSIDTRGAAAIGDYADNSSSFGLISFPLPKFPSGSNITAATLSVYQAKGSGTPYTDLSGQLLAVNVGAYTQLSLSVAGLPLQSPVSVGLSSSDSVGFKTADVTAMLADDLSRGSANAQFRICFNKDTDKDSTRDFVQIITAQASNDNKPSLSFTYDYP